MGRHACPTGSPLNRRLADGQQRARVAVFGDELSETVKLSWIVQAGREIGTERESIRAYRTANIPKPCFKPCNIKLNNTVARAQSLCRAREAQRARVARIVKEAPKRGRGPAPS